MGVDDSFTKILLHFNGDDESTTITDEGGSAWTISNYNVPTGLTKIDQAYKKFGSASLRRGDGYEFLDLTGGMTSDINPGAQDFTIDYQFLFHAEPYSSAEFAALHCNTGNQSDVLDFSLRCNGSGLYEARLYCTASTGTSPGTMFTSHFTLTLDAWHHLEACRSGNDYHIFLDGVLLNTWNKSAHTYNLTGGTLISYGDAGEQWIDELRVSVGIARHTEAFTPPTEEYSETILVPYILISPMVSGTMMVTKNDGDADFVLPMFTLLAVGIGENLGRAGLYLPIFTLSAEGVDFPIGEGNLILPMLSLFGVGQINELGEASIDIPMLRLSAISGTDILGYGNIKLPILTLCSEALVGEVGEASLTIPIFRISGVGVDGAVGEGEIAIPIFTLSASGYPSIEGIANLTLPMFTLVAESLTIATDFLNLVMNIRNQALTLYANYAFNSLCRFDGKHLGMTENRIYDLDSGVTDDGTLIDWNLRTGYLDLDQKIKLKLKQAWFSYKSNGDLIITTVQPDGTEYEYDLTGYEITEDGLRVKFGKGLGTKYVALDVKNVDGSSMTLDMLRLNFDKFKKER